MTLPILVWRQSALYSINSATSLGILTGLRDMFVAEAASHGGRWTVNYWDGVSGVLELKLAGTQVGVAASQRILLFGGQVAHSDALSDGNYTTPAETHPFYAYYSLDAGTSASGPSVSYSVGDPYPSSTKKHKGSIASQAAPASLPATTAYIIDAEEALAIVVNTLSGPYTLAFGRLLDDNSDGRWCKLMSGNIVTSAPTLAYSPWFAPGAYDNSFNYPVGAYIDEVGGGVYSLARIFSDLSYNSSLASATLGAIFHPILVASRQRGTSNAWQAAGWLRQLRYGPTQPDRTVIYSSGTATGYVLAHPSATYNASLIFDFVA